MWLLLIIYLTGFSSLLSILVRFSEAAFNRKESVSLEKPNEKKIEKDDIITTPQLTESKKKEKKECERA